MWIGCDKQPRFLTVIWFLDICFEGEEFFEVAIGNSPSTRATVKHHPTGESSNGKIEKRSNLMILAENYFARGLFFNFIKKWNINS